ncbi:MAG TPA: response regulator [Verrucomicrobiae bacterium]|nr:response regulator [Verrucomicrobiae bacterium]
MKLLIVDDSSVVRRAIQRHIDDGRVSEIIEARNGVEAVTMFTVHRPDLVTMDITMPEMDGIRAVEELVKLRPDVRILIVSAMADKHTAIQAVRKGAKGFLLKPFNSVELNEALEEILTDGI